MVDMDWLRKLNALQNSLVNPYEKMINQNSALMSTLRDFNSIGHSAAMQSMLNAQSDSHSAFSWYKKIDALQHDYAKLRSYAENFNSPVFNRLRESNLDTEPAYLKDFNKVWTKALSPSAIQNLVDMAKPYETLLKSIDNYPAILGTRNLISDRVRHLNLPIIDSATALAISQMWGESGVASQLDALGISDSEELDDSDENSYSASSFDTWTAISIIFTILITLYQLHDSQQTELRLNNRIDKSSESVNQNIQKLEKLIEELATTQQKVIEPIQYVVKSRHALIRQAPQSGSKVVAEIFSNQVVGALEVKGKWVEVKYYDWLHQNYKTGWVLKKYLVRVK